MHFLDVNLRHTGDVLVPFNILGYCQLTGDVAPRIAAAIKEEGDEFGGIKHLRKDVGQYRVAGIIEFIKNSAAFVGAEADEAIVPLAVDVGGK